LQTRYNTVADPAGADSVLAERRVEVSTRDAPI
jgi:hypothetical protein